MLLNGFDCIDPLIYGAEESETQSNVRKNWSGLPIGANLEPVDMNAEMLETRIEISPGRQCNGGNSETCGRTWS